MNILLGYTLGSVLGGWGVIVGMITSLLTSSYIVVLMYHREHDINWREIFSNENFVLLLFFICVVVSIGFLVIQFGESHNSLVATIMIFLFFIIITFPMVWKSSIRSDIQRLLKQLVSKNI
jgi:uncharacterized membrane protein YhaH (DUF805 family)